MIAPVGRVGSFVSQHNSSSPESADDLESLEATIELLSDPSAIAEMAEAEQALERGEHTTLDEMRELMARRRNDGR